MKLNTTDFGRKCQHPLLMAAGSLPLVILLAARTQPEVLAILPLFAVLYVFIAWVCLVMPGRLRMLAAALGVIVLTVLAVVVLPMAQSPGLVLIPLGYAALLFAALPVAGWPRNTELHPAWHVAGVLAHILLQLVADYARRSGSLLYEPVGTVRMVSFLIFITLTLLALNRSSLDTAAQSRVQVPVRMRRQNLVLTMGLLVVALVVAALPVISQFLSNLWDWVVQGIAKIALFLTSLLSHESAGSGGGGSELYVALELGETQEPGLFQMSVEKILYAAALIAAVMLVIWMGKKLLKRLKLLVGWLWQKLSRFGNAATKDYEDEITDTRDEGQYERTGFLQRFRERLSRPDESRMTPAQRVRYRYLRLRRKHTDWNAASTARETLPGEAARLYERARYGAQSLTDAEAEQFRESTRRV